MKLALKQLNPNPFKKEINGGQLSEETISKIRANIKELGLMGALPVFKKDNKIYLVAGHHRVESLRREYGDDYLVSVELHNYNDDQALRGMVVENLTQRNNEHVEEKSNLLCIRKYLIQRSCSRSEQHRQGKRTDLPNNGDGNVRDIAEWLNKNGQIIMSIGKISNILSIADKLSPTLQEKVNKADNSNNYSDEDILPVKDAAALTSINDHKEQEALAEILNKSKLKQADRLEALTAYKQAPDEIKEKVIAGDVKLEEIKDVVLENQIKENNKDRESPQFIPNFKEVLRQFDSNVTKLEQQVALFRNMFRSKSFSYKYNQLGNKERRFMDVTISDIKKRIMKCNDEVEYFTQVLSNAQEQEALE